MRMQNYRVFRAVDCARARAHLGVNYGRIIRTGNDNCGCRSDKIFKFPQTSHNSRPKCHSGGFPVTSHVVHPVLLLVERRSIEKLLTASSDRVEGKLVGSAFDQDYVYISMR